MRIRITPFLQSAGLLLISYSLIREAFGGGLPSRVVDPHEAPNPVMQYFNQAQEAVFNIGGKLGMIPTQHAVTAMERRLDAELAIVGFLFLILVAIISFVQKLRGR